MPKPLSVTDKIGLTGSLDIMLSVAVRVPISTGVNATFMVQLVLVAGSTGTKSESPHVPDRMVKSPGFVPPIVILLIKRSALPEFDRVTSCVALGMLTS